MNRQRTIIIVIAGIVVLAICIGLFLHYFERVETEITTGYSNKARRNSFLAAERFINQIGIPAEVIHGRELLNKLPPESDTVFAVYTHIIEQKNKSKHLLEWIKRGGHLILEIKPFDAPDGVEADTPFLDKLGILPKRSGDIIGAFKNKIKTMVRIYEGGEKYAVEFTPQYSLKTTIDNYHLMVKDKNGIHIIEYKLGDGLITALSDFDIWRNKHIGKNDHAALLSSVLGEKSGKIWILATVDMPSIFDLLWRHAHEAIISGLILVILLLWKLYDRFGPYIEINKQQRRSLIEHLDAVGQFEWRLNDCEGMLDSVRNELHHHIEARRPDWKDKSIDEKIIWLSKHTRLQKDDISSAVYGPCKQRSSFSHLITLLQIIRKRA